LLGYETCKAFISFKDITDEKRKKLINYCKLNPNIINIVITIGPWDMEMEFEVKNFEEYYNIMNDIREKYNEIVKSYDSVLFSSEPKQSFMPGA
jgi:DNA-binding Lrp family transcriptional regulator